MPPLNYSTALREGRLEEYEAGREVKRLAFEERRVGRVEEHIRELKRDHLEIFNVVKENIIHVPYYETKDEQDRFLNSIADTHIGAGMLRMQDKWNKDYRIPLILPKFSNFPNITIPEQQWLAMFGLVIDITAQTIGATRKPDAFKRIEQAKTEIGTGFKRGQAYQPAVTEEVIVDAPQEITLDSIVSGITQAVTVQEAAAEPLASAILPAPTLSQETRKIIDDWSTKKIIVPNWFANNNINWVLQGKISEEEFIAGYTNLLNTGVITIPTAPTPPPPPPPPIDTSTSLTMISQKWDYFDIVDGRAKGQITFRATSDFNPYYYGKELVNYMQLVNNQGLTIVLKPNVLRFTQTETDETIQYDEGVGDLKSLKVESYVWTHDNQPMSSLYKFPIYDGKPPGTGTGELARTDFLAKIGGVLAGSIAIALLLPKRIGK